MSDRYHPSVTCTLTGEELNIILDTITEANQREENLRADLELAYKKINQLTNSATNLSKQQKAEFIHKVRSYLK